MQFQELTLKELMEVNGGTVAGSTLMHASLDLAAGYTTGSDNNDAQMSAATSVYLTGNADNNSMNRQ